MLSSSFLQHRSALCIWSLTTSSSVQRQVGERPGQLQISLCMCSSEGAEIAESVIVTRLRTEKWRVWLPIGARDLSFKTSRPPLGATQFTTQWVPELFPGGKAVGTWRHIFFTYDVTASRRLASDWPKWIYIYSTPSGAEIKNEWNYTVSSPLVQQPNAGQGHLIREVSRSTTMTDTLGRTPLDDWSARRKDLCLTTHNTHKRQISMPPAGFEPAIPACKRL